MLSFADHFYGRPVVQAIKFCSCGFFLVLSRCRLDVYHTSTHDVALVQRQNACMKCAARCSLMVVCRVDFWATVCKTVHPMLSDVVCLSVCNVGVLWPNGWTDKDETWHAGKPRPRGHCVRWEPSSPPQKGGGAPSTIFGPCLLWQTSGWIKMAFGMEVGLGPGYIVLDGDPAPLPKKGAEPPIFGPCLLWSNGWMHQDATSYAGRPQPR